MQAAKKADDNPITAAITIIIADAPHEPSHVEKKTWIITTPLFTVF